MSLSIELYKKLFLIRTAEQAIIEYYHEDDMKTPMHMSMGQEAVVTGVCHAMSDQDQVLGTYRSHALYLAKTQKINTFFAEMYGKKTGTANGKAGSMHLSEPGLGMMLSSAIVASSISTAVGIAMANKMQGNDKITAVFFGDGAVDAGTFWESLNFACLSKLGIMFVLEDNSMAVHTNQDKRYGYKAIERIIEQYDCDVYVSETTDVEEIYHLTQRAKAHMRKTGRPVFLKLKYYRYLEHVGINYDFHDNYRDENEYKKWLDKDPITMQRQRILNSSERLKIQSIENIIIEDVAAGIEFAKQSPFASIDVLTQDVFQ